MKKLISVWGRGLWLPFFVLFLCWGLAFDGLGQSVDCPECSVGVCEGAALYDYVIIADGDLTAVTGDVNPSGPGSSLNDFFFQDNDQGQIVFSFDNGVTVPMEVQFVSASFTVNEIDCNTIELNPAFNSPDWTYSWEIIKVNIGANTPLVLGGDENQTNPTINLDYSGEYIITLTVSNPGTTCSETFTQTISIGDTVIPELIFENDGGEIEIENGEVGICNDEIINFQVFNGTQGTLINPTIEININGESWQPMGNPTLIPSELYTTSNAFPVCIRITENGCEYLSCYNVIIVVGPIPQLNATVGFPNPQECAGEEISLDLQGIGSNIPGTTYMIDISCDGGTFFSQSWPWGSSAPPNPLEVNPPGSSCGCEDGEFEVEFTANNVCTNEAGDPQGWVVNLTADGSIISSEDSTICAETVVDFAWDSQNNITDVFGCEPDLTWLLYSSGDLLDGPLNSTTYNYYFDQAGIFQIALYIEPDGNCMADTLFQSICVNPQIADLAIDTIAPGTICFDDDYEVMITFDDEQIYCDPLTIEWELFEAGTNNEIESGFLNADESPVDLNFLGLEVGDYDIALTFSIDECSEDLMEWDFHVADIPEITLTQQEFDCLDEVYDFSSWIEIQDSNSIIELVSAGLFEGEANECNNSGVELSSNYTNTIEASNNMANFSGELSWLLESGPYYLLVEATNYCGTVCDTLSFVVPEPGNATFELDDNEFCLSEGSTQLNISGNLSGNIDITGPSYSLNDLDPGDTWNFGNLQEGIYTLTFDGDCGEAGDTTITLFQNPEPTIVADPLSTTLCSDGILELSASDCPTCSFEWLPSSETSQTITIPPPLSSQLITLNVEDQNGCEGSSTYQYFVETFDLVINDFQDAYCLEQCMDFDSFNPPSGLDLGDLSFDILDAGLNSIENPAPTDLNPTWCFPSAFAEGNYFLVWSYTSQNSCFYSDTLSFSITGNQSPEISADSTVCISAGQIELTGDDAAADGEWELISCPPGQPCNFSSSANPAFYTIGSTTEPGTYVFQYDGTCLIDTTISVEVFANPPIQLVNNIPTICPEDTLNLSEFIQFTDLNFSIQDVSELDSCSWVISPLQDTLGSGCFIQAIQETDVVNYAVTVYENGCPGTAGIDIQTAQQPWTDIDTDTTFCDNELATLDLTSFQSPVNSNFTWSLLPSGPDPIPSPQLTNFNLEPLDPGQYQFVLNHELGGDCNFSDTLFVNIEELEELEAVPNSDTICAGEELSLVFITDLPNFDPLNIAATLIDCPIGVNCNVDISLPWDTEGFEPGIYEITFSGTCLETDTILIELFPIPIFNLESSLGSDLCPGDTTILSIDPNFTFEECVWTSTEPNPPITNIDCSVNASPDSSATYTATVTQNGCSNSDSLEIEVLINPFPLYCDTLENEYCTNDTICIQLQSLLPDEDITQSGFTWWLDNTQLSNLEICLDTVSDGTHFIWYDYLDPNGCNFTDSCSFNIDPDLTPLSVEGTVETNNSETLMDGDTLSFCMGDAIALESNSTENGIWDLISSEPAGSTCPPNFTSDTLNLEWNTAIGVDCPGIYGFQFSAVCVDTTTVYVQVFPNPEVEISFSPNDSLCAGDSLFVEAIYLGDFEVDSIVISGPGLSGNIPPTSTNDSLFTWEFGPGILDGTYQLYLEDATICPFQDSFEIEIQTVDFEIDDCSALDSQYCSNSDLELNLQDELISGSIPPGVFTWYLVDLSDDTLEISETFNPSDYDAGDYLLYYDFEHDEEPKCVFSDTCAFTINDLSPVTINAEVGYCLQETSAITATYDDEFSGNWEILNLPPECSSLDVNVENPTTFEFTADCIGDYSIMFSGNCLDTVIVSFEVVSIPVAQWTPTDLSPCLNECFEFAPDVLENFSTTQWTYDGTVTSSPICFQDGNPGNLCLEANIDHIVEGQTVSCAVEDCEVLDPIESPGGVLDIPDEYCAGDGFVIDGDWVNESAFQNYEDCEFAFTPVPDATCDEPIILDENGPYGNFPYLLVLSYGETCTDSLSDTIFIPEPPSASLLIEYDTCIADIDVALPGLSGDNLSFDWGFIFYDNNTIEDASFLLGDQTSTLPENNPILLSQLNLPVDSAFIVSVTIFNENCPEFDHYSISLDTAGLYVAPPDLNIDIIDTTGVVFCTPAELSFQAFVSTTQFIDSVTWVMTSSQADDVVYSATNPSTEPTEAILFENFQTVTDTITIDATAYGRCGIASAQEDIYIVPDSVFVKIPDSLGGACGGDIITFETIELFGYFQENAATITTNPIIPGFSFSHSDDYTTYTLNIPPSTQADDYLLTLTLEGCGSDSDFTNFSVYPDPTTLYQASDEGCTGIDVIFTNETEGATDFIWDFGDGNQAGTDVSLPNPVHTYQAPGVYNVTLTATSDKGCDSEYLDSIAIYGPDPSFRLEENRVCSGTPVFYEMPENDFLIDAQWEFLLPGIDTIVSIADTNRFITLPNTTDETQNWIVSLTLTDEFGCVAYNDTSLSIFPLPIASFTYDLNANCAIGEVVQFDNVRQNNVAYEWDFGDPESGFLNQVLGSDPEHLFSGMGEYVVTMTAKTTTLPRCEAVRSLPLNCIDGIVFVPNAFTPDENGINDVFKPTVYGLDEIDFGRSDYYSFIIFDRWGRTIWETNDPEKGWNGQSPDNDYYAQSEMYSWRLEIKYPEETKEWVGSVVLLK